MSSYRVFVTPNAIKEIKGLPGNMRQRVRRCVSDLADDPRPNCSKGMTQKHTPREVRRIRIENWRIIYVVSDDEAVVDVLGVRKRPPYDYADLEKLLDQL